jgi:polysaccharide biosynthesis protein PslG
LPHSRIFARLMSPAILAALILAPSAAAKPALPREFFGMVPQATPTSRDFTRMGGVVGTLRIPVEWGGVEPRPGSYDFGSLDETVGQAADAGIRVLPFVYGSPAWLSGDPARPPLQSARARRAWTELLRTLVRRYGSDGSLWQGRARTMPIRRWQIWNEPNYLLFWHPRPQPARYAQLLRISARTIRRDDPGATIVAAGVAPVEAGITPWAFLRRLYEVPGVRRDFDVVALHPYAPYVGWVKTQIRFVREVMVEAGDGATPLQLTELGVASDAAFRNPFDKGRAGQATFLRKAFALTLHNRRRWHLAGVDWFTWQDSTAADPHCVFCQYGGLFDAGGMPKPAWGAFRRIATSSNSGV